MIGISLTDSGVELLGQRRGLDAYVTAGKTMGIPILYPWANRLGANSYTVDGEVVTLAPGATVSARDPNGLPIHGVLAGYRGWRVMTESANELIAELDFGADPALLASFPFPHLLVVRVGLVDRTLSVHTTVAATGDKAVPLCFGFHPYLALPELPRAQWTIETPALRHLTVDDRGLPTGETSAQPATSESLGDKAFDDGYDQVTDGAVFAVSGGGRRIEVRFELRFSGGADLRAPRRGPGVFRADGRPDGCIAPRRLPFCAPRRAGGRSVFDPRLSSPNGFAQRGLRGCQTTSAVLLGTTATSRRWLARNATNSSAQFLQPGLQCLNLIGELDDALDAGQVDALVLREPLHLAQQIDIMLRIAAPTTGCTARADQPEPIVGAQRLRMHSGQFGGHRDEERPRFPFLRFLAISGYLPIRPVGRNHWRVRPPHTLPAPPGRRPPSSAGQPP